MRLTVRPRGRLSLLFEAKERLWWQGIAVYGLVLLLGAGVAALPRPRPAAQRGEQLRFLEVGGRRRSYLVHVPRAIKPARKVPVVIVLHGGGGNAWNIARTTGFSARADAAGFLAVYPNGTGRRRFRFLTWNAGNCCGYALDRQVDDVGFIRALLRQLRRDYPVDDDRVFATGMSNGGMMAYRLAAELSDEFAAIAPVAAAFNLEDARPAHPVAVIAFHGTADEHVLYGGGAPKKRADSHPRVDRSQAQSIAFWVKRNGCRPRPRKLQRGKIIRETYPGGEAGTEVVLITVRGGKHAWPGGEKGYARGDSPTREISATETMWDFFAAHPRRRAASSSPPSRPAGEPPR